MSVSLAPQIRFVGRDNNGNIIPGGKLFTYAAGTTTKQASYTDSTGGTPNVNPVILDGRGEADVWLNPLLSYKLVLSPSTDTDPPTNALWTKDNIPGGVNAASVNFTAVGAGGLVRSGNDKMGDIVAIADFDTSADARTAANNLRPLIDTAAGSLGYQDPAFTITKAQAASKFRTFQTVANGVGFNAYQSITLNGAVIAGTNANFLATSTPDNVTFSGWGLRGGAGTSSLVVANFGSWIENNSATTWTVEIDSNNEGATQSEGNDNGGLALAINTGSTFSPDSAIAIRRMTGAGTGPGFLRGLNIEGARNVGVRVMAMDTTSFPSLTPAAPGTVTALATGKSSDTQYRFTVNESGIVSWGPGGSTMTDVTLSRSGVGALSCSGNFSLFPAASATPATNGQMTWQLTNNTTLVIKVKGSDGTVRSATLTLS
jgi:hypothetical protein